jgi:hypothetical protein
VLAHQILHYALAVLTDPRMRKKGPQSHANKQVSGQMQRTLDYPQRDWVLCNRRSRRCLDEWSRNTQHVARSYPVYLRYSTDEESSAPCNEGGRKRCTQAHVATVCRGQPSRLLHSTQNTLWRKAPANAVTSGFGTCLEVSSFRLAGIPLSRSCRSD